MTNQEAIEVIKVAQAQIEWDLPLDYATAFDMAIEALKCMSLNADMINADAMHKLFITGEMTMEDFKKMCRKELKRDDLISRQRVSDLFDAWEAAELDHHVPKKLRDRLKAIPSAQPELENEPIGCNGCRYDWFGDPRCSRCARSFPDYYEDYMRGEPDE